MKIRNWIIAILLLAVAALLASNTYFYYKATRLYVNNFLSVRKFSEDNIININNTMKQPNAVLIGNSITEQWSMRDPQFLTNNNYLNSGVGGQTSLYLLLRFRNDVVDLNPKVVVIGAGINDIAENAGTYNAKFTFDNIKSMADIAHASGIKVILTSVLPAANIPWNYLVKDAPDKILELNQTLEAYAQEKGYGYANYYPALLGNDRGLKPEYTIDGIHLTTAAYKVMEPILKKEIDKALAQ